MMTLNRLFPVALLASLFLGGCVWIDDTNDLRNFVAKEKQKKTASIKPLPEFKPYHSFVYEGASMRSPFKPLVAIVVLDPEDDTNAGNNGIKPDQDRAKDYLETFSLDNLKMVGSINLSADGSRWALIKDNAGEVHRVSNGDYMGTDYGEITTINSDSVELVEIVSNGRGGWMKRPRSVVMD